MSSFNPTSADLQGTKGMSKEKKAAKAKEGKTPTAVNNKTVCSISKKDFLAKGGNLSIKIGESSVDGDAREFSTGSFGYFISGKATILIDGKPVKCQVGCNVIVIGSKESK